MARTVLYMCRCMDGKACASYRLAVIDDIRAACGVPTQATQPSLSSASGAKAGSLSSSMSLSSLSADQPTAQVDTAVRFVVFDALGRRAEVGRLLKHLRIC